jgi:hypothetical protein
VVQPKVGKLGCGMSKDSGIERETGLPRMLRNVLDGPLIPKIPYFRGRGGHGK